ncbi:hypothetical protein GCM10027615_08260 [Plantactinospora veratri]
MGMLCAVSFNRYGRLYYLDPGELRPAVGDRVLVPTDEGTEVAECVWAAQWVSEDTSGFPRLAGLAGEEDLRRDEMLRKRKAEAKVAAKRLIREHGLPMKVVAVDHVVESAPSGGRTVPAPPSTSPRHTGSTSGRWSATWARPCTAGSSCASSLPGTRRGCRAASAPAGVTSAAPPS